MIHGPLSWIAWDPEQEQLLAVRDRVGIEPVYFCERGGRVVLSASASRVVRALSGTRRPEESALIAHLHGHGPPPGSCFLSGVNPVEPGASLRIGRRTLSSQRYWRPDAKARVTAEGGSAAVASLLDDLTAEYSTSQRSAIALSGGLDSTGLAAFLASHGRERLVALHCGTPSLPKSDESAEARRAARHLGVPLVVLRGDLHLPLSRPEGITTWEDSPVFPAFTDFWEAIWSHARQLGAKVLYTGAGGDHLFGGSNLYPYVDLLLTGQWLRLSREMMEHRRRGGVAWTRLLKQVLIRPLARTLVTRWRPQGRITVPWLARQRKEEWRQLHRTLALEPGRNLPMLPGSRERLRFVTHGGTAEVTAVIAERARQHGLSLRHPLLDARLIDLILALPSWEIYKGGMPKALLREVLTDRLPRDLLDKRDKVLHSALFRQGMVGSGTKHVLRLLTGMRSAEAGLVDEVELRKAYDRYCRTASGGALLWQALTLEDWLRRHF